MRPEHPKRAENPKRARMLIRRDLAWLEGCPHDGLTWRFTPLGGEVEFTCVDRELLSRATRTLTGTAYGEPRMTQDIDVVIDPKTAKARVEQLLDSLAGSDFLFDAKDVRRAVATEDLFQLLDQAECLKLDIYPRKMIPGELDRGESLELSRGSLFRSYPASTLPCREPHRVRRRAPGRRAARGVAFPDPRMPRFPQFSPDGAQRGTLHYMAHTSAAGVAGP